MVPFDVLFTRMVFFVKARELQPLRTRVLAVRRVFRKAEIKVVAGASRTETMRNVVLAGFHILTFCLPRALTNISVETRN